MSYASCQELGRKVRELKNLDHALLTAGILSFDRQDSPEGWETCEILPTSAHATWTRLIFRQPSRSTIYLQPSLVCSSYPRSSPPPPIPTLLS